MRRVRDLAPYIGQRITAKILEFDRTRNNVVLVTTYIARSKSARST
jgi:ribosomal protein S1